MKSDIWSLGISLVEIANGLHPYEGANQFKLLEMVVRKPSPCLDQDDRYCEPTANFVSKCLKVIIVKLKINYNCNFKFLKCSWSRYDDK